MNSNSADDPVLRHFSEAARHIQKGLVVSLSSMDFSEHEGMVLRANEAFNIMNSLSTDYLHFYDSVKEFIRCSALLAQVGSDDSSRAELQSQYEEKKIRFDEASQQHTEASAILLKSQEHVSHLEEEIVSVKDHLKKLEAKLVMRKTDVSSLSSEFAKASQDLLDLEGDLTKMLEELKSSEEVDASREAAERAFYDAKAILEIGRAHV